MSKKSIKVLLVEDNPADAKLLKERLKDIADLDFHLTLVDTLAGATGELAAETFDVMLLDLSLPDSTGLDTVHQAHEASPETPIVVLSGADDEDMAVEAVRQGAEDYLVKGQTDPRVLARDMRYAI